MFDADGGTAGSLSIARIFPYLHVFTFNDMLLMNTSAFSTMRTIQHAQISPLVTMLYTKTCTGIINQERLNMRRRGGGVLTSSPLKHSLCGAHCSPRPEAKWLRGRGWIPSTPLSTSQSAQTHSFNVSVNTPPNPSSAHFQQSERYLKCRRENKTHPELIPWHSSTLLISYRLAKCEPVCTNKPNSNHFSSKM